MNIAMSFENIRLPAFLIADLYKDHLVEIENTTEKFATINKEKPSVKNNELEVSQAKTIKYLGQNQKAIIAIVNDSEAAIINDTDLAFLTNILKACNLNLADIAIINKHNQELHFAEIKEQLDVEKILLFDVSPSSIILPFSIPHFQVQPYAGCTIVTAPSLSIINKSTEESRLLKSKLWLSLKQIFKIS
jgi:hypothetical protein